MRIHFSKTKVGAVLLGAAQIVRLRWPEWAAVLEAAGIALAGVGVRDAIAKSSR